MKKIAFVLITFLSSFCLAVADKPENKSSSDIVMDPLGPVRDAKIKMLEDEVRILKEQQQALVEKFISLLDISQRHLEERSNDIEAIRVNVEALKEKSS